MTAPSIVADLTGTTQAFEGALKNLPSAEGRQVVTDLLSALDKAESLDNSERERRLIAVFSRVTLSSVDLELIGTAGGGVRSAVLKNALAQLLPAEHRGLVFRPASSTRLSPAAGNTPAAVALSLATGGNPQPSSSSDEWGFSDVLILSIEDDPATKKLLSSNGFVPLRCASIRAVEEMLERNDGICACLVEGSFMKALDNRAQQVQLIEKLATFSTFIWLRFQEHEGLQPSSIEITEIIEKARCRKPEAKDLSLRDRAGLQERELDFIKNAHNRLNEGRTKSLFVPGEVSAPELKLLAAAMSAYAKDRRFDPHAVLTSVTTRFLQGLDTGAKVAVVKIDDLRVPVIVKLAQKGLILEEVRRFLTFIHKDNPELRPEVHIHGSAALIIFGIISADSGESEGPAPTLEHELTHFWYSEMRQPIDGPDGTSLLAAFSNAAQRLARLNTQHCNEGSFELKANPFLASLKAMENAGFDWGLGAEALTARSRAEEILNKALAVALCHGDAHARNILIRGHEGHLIDYAYSGPGHPCGDLVRLELTVFFNRFIPLGSEAEIISLQRDLTIDRLPIDELLSRNPIATRSKINALCMQMCVVARDSLAAVLKAHNLEWEHYSAVKLLSAWQSLQVPSLQQSLVRNVIEAISRVRLGT